MTYTDTAILNWAAASGAGLTPCVVRTPSSEERLAAARQELIRALRSENVCGVELAAQYSQAALAVFQTEFEREDLHNVFEGQDIALAALGGSGAGTMSLHSDNDLFLIAADVPSRPEMELWLPAWHRMEARVQRLGLDRPEVRWQVRSGMPELFQDEKLISMNALLSARMLLGSQTAFSNFQSHFKREIAARFNEVVMKLSAVVSARYQKHARRSAEPNLKDGIGGLRDLDTIEWLHALSRLASGTNFAGGLLSAAQRRTLQAARSNLMLWKHALHATARDGERGINLTTLSRSRLDRVLGVLGAEAVPALKLSGLYRDMAAVESLLKSTFVSLLEAEIAPRESSRLRGLRGGLMRLARTPQPQQAQIAANCLSVCLAFQAEPEQQCGYLSPASLALDVVQQQAAALDERAFSSRECMRRLGLMLSPAGSVGAALCLMSRAGLLTKLLPELAELESYRIPDGFHAVTAGEHALAGAALLDRAFRGEVEELAPFAEQIGAIHYPRALYLAMLLHHSFRPEEDAGALPDNGRASEHVRTRAGEIGLDAREQELARKLVSLRRTMVEASESLCDPETVRSFVARVGDSQLLSMLFLFTYADKATANPEAWDAGKRAALAELFRKSCGLIEGRVESAEQKIQRLATQISESPQLHREIEARQVREHLLRMPSSYLALADDEVILGHLRLIEELHRLERTVGGTGQACVVDWLDLGNDQGGRFQWRTHVERARLLVVARDTRGLFVYTTGALARSMLDITEAHIFTGADGYACNVFAVEAAAQGANTARWRSPFDFPEYAERVLKAVADKSSWTEEARRKARGLRGHSLPSSEAPPAAIQVAQRGALLSVTVQTPDRLGLACRLGQVFMDLDLNICWAKLGVGNRGIRDHFLLVPESGRPIDAVLATQVEHALRDELDERG